MMKEAREEILKLIAGLERNVSMMDESGVSTLEPITTVQKKNPLTLKPKLKKSVTKEGSGEEEEAAADVEVEQAAVREKEFLLRTKTEPLMTTKRLTAQFLAKASFWIDLDTVFVQDESLNPHQKF
ncbi:hypothetical protein BGZ81_002906 [Podila clonocystis]|nr:hypothetical protein BGZ81_002906 [Podila clonocystis]